MDAIRVAVLVEDELFMEGLRQLLACEPQLVLETAQASSIAHATIARTDVLLLDSRLDGALGACCDLRRAGRPWVLLLAGSENEDWAVAALECGARGVLTHAARADDLVKAVRAVHDGQIWAPHAVIARLVDHHFAGLGPAVPGLALERLSEREHGVLRLTVNGLCNKEIADQLGISAATVKAHLASIFRKLELHDRMELALRFRDAVESESMSRRT